MNLREYFLDPETDENGKLLPFSRFDIGLAVVLAFVLMVAAAYTFAPHHAWTPIRIIVVSATAVGVTLIAQHRRVVFGGAFGVVAVRLVIGGILGGHHVLGLLLWSLVPALLAWVLLKDLG
jgi:hypothetical protein